MCLICYKARFRYYYLDCSEIDSSVGFFAGARIFMKSSESTKGLTLFYSYQRKLKLLSKGNK